MAGTPPKVQRFPPPPFNSPFWEDAEKTRVAFPWVQYFRAITNAIGANRPIRGSRTTGGALENLLKFLDAIGMIQDESTP